MTTQAVAPSNPARVGLRQRLGLATATALVVGEVIGVGIFLTPAGMARSLGSPFAMFAVWIVMGSIALAGAISFGGLAARFPQAGGGGVFSIIVVLAVLGSLAGILMAAPRVY
jgi:APA family basic amino acid/polyamine antiporter